jgi:broad specificity phosphatase PhoE
MPMTTRLILIRHAQTASNGNNPDPLMSGWADLPLNAEGRHQREALYQRFLDEPVAEALYSSPSRRALQTAGALLRADRKPLRLAPDLREIHCGEVDGLPIAAVKERYASFWERNMRQDDDHFRWPGGESYIELRRRSLTALDRIAAAHPGARILVVTHAGVISQVLGALHGISPARWQSFRPENTSLTELAWDNGNGRMVSFNDHRHLAQSLAPC